jgi:hypothetical protein
MKKNYILSSVIALSSLTALGQDLQISNIQFTYDFITANLDVSFDLDNTGTFTTFDAVECEVSIIDLGSTEYSVGSATSDDFGLASGATEGLSVTNIDLDNVSGLLTGDYYVKVCADVTDIETETNEGNNCTQDNTSFSFESLTTSISEATMDPIALMFPNPVKGNSFSFLMTSNSETTPTVEVFSVSGKAMNIRSTNFANNVFNVHAEELTPGIYFYTLSVQNTIVKGRFVRK